MKAGKSEEQKKNRSIFQMKKNKKLHFFAK